MATSSTRQSCPACLFAPHLWCRWLFYSCYTPSFSMWKSLSNNCLMPNTWCLSPVLSWPDVWWVSWMLSTILCYPTTYYSLLFRFVMGSLTRSGNVASSHRPMVWQLDEMWPNRHLDQRLLVPLGFYFGGISSHSYCCMVGSQVWEKKESVQQTSG